MIKWLHRLFNPHCDSCRQEELENRTCSNCEILRQLLETEKHENKQLLDRILHVPVPEVREEREIKPIMPNAIASLKVRREMLEREDRVRAQILQKKQMEIPKSTQELEQALLGEENAS